MKVRFTGLWRQPDFLKLWAGETISLFGSQITFLALPLTAVLVLHASPSQMGFLTAIEFLPFLVLSLFAGVWVDRLRRRPVQPRHTRVHRNALLAGIDLDQLA